MYRSQYLQRVCVRLQSGLKWWDNAAYHYESSSEVSSHGSVYRLLAPCGQCFEIMCCHHLQSRRDFPVLKYMQLLFPEYTGGIF